MTIIVNGIEKNITMKAWNGSQYSPDVFGDVEPNVHDWQEMTEDEFGQLVDFWQDEVESYNNGEYSEQFGERTHTENDPFTDEPIEKVGDELVLFVDDMSVDGF